MRDRLFKVAVLIALTGAFSPWIRANGATAASKTPVLLELFTSEGCSSCPPADRLLQSLDEKQPIPGAEVVVLSEHVDYWNGDGWVDPYSSRLFSERQQKYAEQFGLDGVYTPQAVVDGAHETVGSNAAAVSQAVESSARAQKTALTLTHVVRDGKQIKFHLTSAELQGAGSTATIYAAIAEDKVQSNVGGGENGGRSLTHVAVVRALVAVAKLKAGSSFSQDLLIALPPRVSPNNIRVVVFLQSDQSHKVVGASAEKI